MEILYSVEFRLSALKTILIEELCIPVVKISENVCLSVAHTIYAWQKEKNQVIQLEEAYLFF